MPLTDLKVRTAKPEVRKALGSRGKALKNPKPEDLDVRPRLTKLSDGGGMSLWITPDGAKSWRVAYRFAGAQKLLALGTYPAMPLKEAREARDAARKILAAGQDPALVKRATRAAQAIASANTFAAIAEELLEKKRREEKADRTLEKMEWLIRLATPALGARPIRGISPPTYRRCFNCTSGAGTTRRPRSCAASSGRFSDSPSPRRAPRTTRPSPCAVP